MTTFRVWLPETPRRRSPWVLMEAENEADVRRRYKAATKVTALVNNKGGTMTKTAPAAAELRDLKLAELHPAEDNPRRSLGDLTELATSIRSMGILEPLVAVAENGHYKLVAGARRFAAAKLAGLTVVPVIVRELDARDRLAAMLIENLQRADLAPLEEAAAFRRLVEEFGLTQRALSEKVGRSQGQISKRLALLDLPAEAVKAIDSGGITIEEALELTKIKDPKRAAKVWKMRGQVYGGLARAVRDELEQIKRDELVAAATKKLEASGLRVVAFKTQGPYSHALPEGVFEIAKSGDYNALRLDPEAHKTEPCHAAAVDPRDGSIVDVCTDRKRHPKAKTERELYTARSSRQSSPTQADSRELEKAKKARREFASAIAQGKVEKQEHSELVLDTLIRSAHQEVLRIACKLLGLEVDRTASYGAALRLRAAKGPTDRQRVDVAVAFATHEEFLGIYYSWDAHASYLELLERHGYKFTPAERKKLPKKAPAKVAVG